MLKSSEHKKSNYKTFNFKIVLKLDELIPQYNLLLNLRIGAPLKA